MNESQQLPFANDSRTQRKRRWRILGAIVLLLGCVGAALAYWHGIQTENLRDDPSMLRYNKAEHNQMGMFYGKAGYLMDDLMHGLQEPSTQAAIIGLASVLVAAGCFLIATLPPYRHDSDFFKPSDPHENRKP
jgi:hypothetical protein